jgi:hypothetical protein
MHGTIGFAAQLDPVLSGVGASAQYVPVSVDARVPSFALSYTQPETLTVYLIPRRSTCHPVVLASASPSPGFPWSAVAAVEPLSES